MLSMYNVQTIQGLSVQSDHGNRIGQTHVDFILGTDMLIAILRY